MQIPGTLAKALVSHLGGEVGSRAGAATDKADSASPHWSDGVLELLGERDQPLQDILQRYDVTHITPEELTRMLDELHQVGIIDKKELQQLSGILGDLQRSDVASDEAVDLIAFYRQKLHRMDRFEQMGLEVNAPPSREDARSRLQWLEKFQAARIGGLDALV